MLRISPSPLVRWRRPAIRVAAGSAVVIAAWCAFLATTIPDGDGHRLGIFWVALDAAEAIAAAATAVALVRRSPLAALTASIFAALMLVDAGVDLATARPGLHLARAVAQAVLGEVPFAVAGVWVAVHARRSRARSRRVRALRGPTGPISSAEPARHHAPTRRRIASGCADPASDTGAGTTTARERQHVPIPRRQERSYVESSGATCPLSAPPRRRDVHRREPG